MDEKKEVEEEPLELEFWQNPEKGKVERDDDEIISDRAYDPDFGKPPKLERDENPGELEMESLPNSPSYPTRALLTSERDSLDASLMRTSNPDATEPPTP